MRLLTKFRAMAINKTSTKGVKDTTKTYYNVVIATQEDAGSLSCTEEVAVKVEPMKTYDFLAEYSDGKYVGLKIVGCELAK